MNSSSVAMFSFASRAVSSHGTSSCLFSSGMFRNSTSSSAFLSRRERKVGSRSSVPVTLRIGGRFSLLLFPASFYACRESALTIYLAQGRIFAGPLKRHLPINSGFRLSSCPRLRLEPRRQELRGLVVGPIQVLNPEAGKFSSR